MNLQPISNNIEDYLKSSYYIDYENQSIIDKANEITINCKNNIEIIKSIYHFVRDDVHHSWDSQDEIVTIKASDVLKYETGICYAKSHLLCAMLRYKGIPTGLCYQRLTLSDNDDSLGYCIHGLNAVYLKNFNKWVRIDARGNKQGVNANFSIDVETLAFSIRSQFDEVDYPQIYFEPHRLIIQTLENSSNALNMCMNLLPDRL